MGKKETLIPIVFICEEINIKSLLVALVSLFENAGEGTTYDVNILSKLKYSNSNEEVFDKLNIKYNCQIKLDSFYEINKGNHKDIIKTISDYYVMLDKCIYLDFNVVVQKDLTELFNFNLENNSFGAVRQIDDNINSNVLLIDCNSTDEYSIKEIDLKYNLQAYLLKGEKSFNFGKQVKINSEMVSKFNRKQFIPALRDNVIFSYTDEVNPFNTEDCSFVDEWSKYEKLTKFNKLKDDKIASVNLIKPNEIYIDSLKLIDEGKVIEGMDIIVELHNKETFDIHLLDLLNEKFILPNKNKLEQRYNQNFELLSKYPYIFNKNFKNQENNTFLIYPVTDNIYYSYNKFSYKFEKIEVNSSMETKYFFENLDNPLLIGNELNEFNLKFLVDNVRKSEDVAYENHIYLYYDNIRIFSQILYYCDFEPLLKDEKLVILFDQEKSMYPIDFKEKYNIDYDSMEFKEVRPNEVKRLIVQQHMFGSAGNGFRLEIIDSHPNIITCFVLEAGFNIYNDKIEIDSFIDIINDAINNDKIHEISEMLYGYTPLMFNFKDNHKEFKLYFTEFKKLCSKYNVKTKKEWLITSFLAYSRIKNFDNNSRISPAIHHMLHYIRTNNDNERDVKGFHSSAVYQKCLDVYNDFKYFYVHNPVRDPIASYTEQYRLPHASYINDLFNFNMFTWWWQDLDFENSANLGISHKFNNRISIRFEDLKLNPKATLVSMCRFFNVPYDNILEVGTRDGETIYEFGKIKDNNGISYYKNNDELVKNISSAFTILSLYDLDKEDVFDEKDIKRLELILYPAFNFFGNYKPSYNDNNNYTDEQIFNLFKTPFKFEKEVLGKYPANKSVEIDGKKITIKEYMNIARLQFAKQAINYRNIVKYNVENNRINTYKVLIPDERYLVNDLYTNYTSLPKLNDVYRSFLID